MADGAAAAAGKPAAAAAASSWDPDALPPAAGAPPPSAATLRRVGNELRQLLEDPLPGVIIVPDDDLALRLHAVIIGPDGTPYEGGFFYFLLQLPHDYGDAPPRVKLMTTGGGSVRFGPNLYSNGKVCLSILGTWSGPAWSPALKLSSVLLSIQSRLSERPLRNEPGFEKVADAARLDAYDAVVRYQTLRVAVVDAVARRDALPPALREAVLPAFAALLDSYTDAVSRHAGSLDGSALHDTLDGSNRGTFEFAALGRRIQELAAQVEAGELV
jgi:ubiquitin-conjugating enzyme E2 Z